MRILLPLLLLLLPGCSTLPAFRKATDKDFGYTIKAGDRPEIFDVRASLPDAVSPEFRLQYLTRAAGEECLARGFLFWDVGSTGPSALRSFCYKHPSKKSLGVLMSQKNTRTLVVEDTLPNSYAPFRPNDLVRRIGGVEVGNIGEFKEQIFKIAESAQKEVSVAVERSAIAISLTAPISEQKESLLNPEMLETLRAKLP